MNGGGFLVLEAVIENIRVQTFNHPSNSCDHDQMEQRGKKRVAFLCQRNTVFAREPKEAWDIKVRNRWPKYAYLLKTVK